MTARHRGFTLIEVLLVVIILGIIASIALPRLSNASATAKASMLMDDLRLMRTQIMVYKGQHCGVSPGHPDGNPATPATQDVFIAQMTKPSNVGGETAEVRSPEFRYGPYLSEMPPNPVNNKITIQIVGEDEEFPSEGDSSHGYIYQPSTLILRADSPGADQAGKLYFDY